MRRRKVQTPRLVLRPLVKADHSTWFEAVTRGPQGSKFEPPPRSLKRSSRAAYDEVLARFAERAREDSMYVSGIFLKHERVLVGLVDIMILQRGPVQSANLGYRIFQPYRRRGYAKEAVLAAMHEAFEGLKLNRLEAVMDLENRPSRALARALGMSREAVRRKYYFEGGRFHDQLVWSAQREDFGHAPLRRLR